MNYYSIRNIKYYPENGKHQEVVWDLPFTIRKGEDSFFYKNAKGDEKRYNHFKDPDKIDERWIVFLDKTANPSLYNLFKAPFLNKDLNKILARCRKMYVKSLEMELIRTRKEFTEQISKWKI